MSEFKDVQEVLQKAGQRPLNSESRTYEREDLEELLSRFRRGQVGIDEIPRLGEIKLRDLVKKEVEVNSRGVVRQNVDGILQNDDPLKYNNTARSESVGSNFEMLSVEGENFHCRSVNFLYDSTGRIIICGNIQDLPDEFRNKFKSGQLEIGIFREVVDFKPKKRKFTLSGQIVKCIANYEPKVGPKLGELVLQHTARELNRRRCIASSHGDKARMIDNPQLDIDHAIKIFGKKLG